MFITRKDYFRAIELPCDPPTFLVVVRSSRYTSSFFCQERKGKFNGYLRPTNEDEGEEKPVTCAKGINNHPGNVHFRTMIKNVKAMYVGSQKNNKKLFSYAIVQSIRSMNPPGRFLKKDQEQNVWYVIGDKEALGKTRQALREGAPKVIEAIKLAQKYHQVQNEKVEGEESIQEKVDNGEYYQSKDTCN